MVYKVGYKYIRHTAATVGGLHVRSSILFFEYPYSNSMYLEAVDEEDARLKALEEAEFFCIDGFEVENVGLYVGT